ncbi:MAG: glycogen debranching enzyme N-terminal domain-containing protein, partial [Candidatus Pacebacteria bacterium]|nr:glycogen debranching enzyme N-terminal domain-containing protein [Candidatus Paceibacterota bacterium]
MKFKKDNDFKRLLSLEWLETNGIGGYASSTVMNCHTRRYHGLLVAKLEKPAGKFVLLSNLEESILIGNNEFFLTSHQYPGVIYPKGFKNLSDFTANEVPAFQYHIGNMLIKKEIMLVQKKNTVLIKYSGFKKGVKAKLRIKPLLAYRDFHSLSRENSQIQTQTFKCKKGFFISPYYGMPDMFFQTNQAFQFRHSHDWYRNFEYIEERSRGFECHEDLFMPGVIEINFKEGEEIVLSASIEEQKESLKRKWNKEISRRKEKIKKLKGSYFQKNLLKAADQFIVEDLKGNKSVIAGYPWFLEWGRDAMIALPGLTLYLEKERDCLEILKTFAKYERKGIVPNFIGD